MPDKSKLMRALKKFKIINPRTGNKVEVPSALTSDDPKLRDLGKKKAKDIISKAKEKMKGGGIDKKLDKDGSVTLKGYEKDAGGYDDSNPMRAPVQIAPKAKKSFTIDKPEPKKEKLPPELQKVKDDAVKKAEKMAKENPMVTSPIQTAGGVFYPGQVQHYHQTGFDPYGEFAVDREKKGNYDATPDDELPAHQQQDSPYHPDNPNRLMRAGKSRKEAKQYVKENKEEVLKYVIKKIINEELDAS